MDGALLSSPSSVHSGAGRRLDAAPRCLSVAVLWMSVSAPRLATASLQFAEVFEPPPAPAPMRPLVAHTVDADGAREPARILLVSLSFRGHVVPLVRLASELVARGHHVTFATQQDGREFVESTGSAKFVSLGKHPFSLRDLHARLGSVARTGSFFWNTLKLLDRVYFPYIEPVFDRLVSVVERDRPDMMIVDVATVGALHIAERFGIPVVVNSPTLVLSTSPPEPYIPAHVTGYSRSMSLLERMFSTVYHNAFQLWQTQLFASLNTVRGKQGLPLLQDQSELFSKSLTLVNTAFGFEYARPLPATVVLTGPLMPSHQLAADIPLPEPVAEWLGDSDKTHPVVVILFGAHTMSFAEDDHVRALASSLENSKLRVLWSLRTTQHKLLGSPLPSNFIVKSNFAQLPVLAHAAVRLVVCPCGLGTVQEALYYGKPVLCLPLLGDQIDVAARLVDTGAGLALSKTELTAADVREHVQSLFVNHSFVANARKLGKVLRAAGGCAAAADHAEAALRHGLDHLLAPEQRLPWHQAVHLDIILISVSLASLYLVGLHAFVLTCMHACAAYDCCGRRCGKWTRFLLSRRGASSSS